MKSTTVRALCVLAVCARAAHPLDATSTNRSVHVKPPAPSVIDAVVHDLCSKRVAVLGEAPMHGFGKTLELKVQIVKRLVDECHYNAFFIESGAYDFLKIQHEQNTGHAVSEPMIAAAVGGLWANAEVEALLPFLLEKMQRQHLVLGGLDDQLGRGTYAQQQMSADLMQYVEGDDRSQCLAILQKHMLWQYTSDAPYGPKDKAAILGCIDKAEGNLLRLPNRAAHEFEVAMIQNLKRTFSRAFMEETQAAADLATQTFNGRDRSMYENFQWLMSHLPAKGKVIVWTATVHAARSLTGVPGQEKFVPLGSYIQREFKDQAFVLGVSAYSGTYAMARQPARTLSAAPAASIESRAFERSDSDAHYFDSSALRTFGVIAARPLGAEFKTAKWDDVFDGLVILREEHPPHSSNR